MIDDNNKISKIKKDYMAGKTYKQIAQKHDVTYNEVLYLVKKKNWKRKSNLSKVKKGNQNAKGNKGGPGAEKGNTRALKTGEYETIYDDLLTDEEKAIMKRFLNLVVYILNLSSLPAIAKSTSAPVERPIQFFCCVLTLSI